MAAADVVKAAQVQQGIDLLNIFLDDDYDNMTFSEEAFPTANIAETSVSNNFGFLGGHTAMTDNNQVYADRCSERLHQQRIGAHAFETNCPQGAGICLGCLGPDDKCFGRLEDAYVAGISASDEHELTSACLMPTTSSPSDESGNALRKNSYHLQGFKISWSPHQESPAQPGTSHTSPVGADSPSNCWPNQPQLNHHLALTPGQPVIIASNPSPSEPAFPNSPFSATAALQSASPSSQPPQPYNHLRTVSPNQATHASAPNHALPFHNSGANPAAPWQQNTSALNRPQCAQMGPTANECEQMCTAQTYGTAPTCDGSSPSHPPCHTGFGNHQPLAFTSVREPHLAAVQMPAPSAATSAVHSAQRLYEGCTTTVVPFVQSDPMGQSAPVMGVDVSDVKGGGRSPWPHRHQASGGVSEHGGISGAGADMGQPADQPMGPLSPSLSGGGAAAGGDAAMLLVSPSFPSFDPSALPAYRTVPPGPGPYAHPHAQPYLRPKYYIRRYGRVPAGYGMPPTYMPYRTMPYPPSVPFSRMAAWRSCLPPAPSTVNGSPAAAPRVSGAPLARSEAGIIAGRVRSAVPGAHPTPHFPPPPEGFPSGASYDTTVTGNPGVFRNVYGAVKPCDMPMYGSPRFPMYGYPVPAGVVPGRFLRSTSHNSLRPREHLHHQQSAHQDLETNLPTNASEYDSYIPCGMSSAAACCSSLAPAWESLKRPRLAGSWSLPQPATPPPVPLSPPTAPSLPQSTPPQPQPSVPPLTARLHGGSRLINPVTPTASSAVPPPNAALMGTAIATAPPTATATATPAAVAPEEDTELQLSLDELYWCIEGIDADEHISGTAQTNANATVGGGTVDGCVNGTGVGLADSVAQTVATKNGSFKSLSVAAPAPLPAAPVTAETGVPDQLVPTGMKAAADTVSTVDTLPAIQQFQQTAQLQTEPVDSSSAVNTVARCDNSPEPGSSSHGVSRHHQHHHQSSPPDQSSSNPPTNPQTAAPPQSNPNRGGGSTSSLLLPQPLQLTTTNESPTGPTSGPSEPGDARKPTTGGSSRSNLPRRFYGNTSRQLPASSVALLQQVGRTEPLPGPVKVTVVGVRAPSRTGGGGSSGGGVDEGVVGSGGVIGMFHVLPYLEGAKCIEYGGEMVSRSAFERAGGSMMAKWYRSIKVLPDGVSLGKWLASNNLPVLKGNPRCSKKGGKQNGAES